MNTSTLTFNSLWNGSKRPSSVAAGSRDYAVSVTFSMETGDMIIKFVAPFHDDPAPNGPPGRFEGLWDYEVFELFVGPGIITSDQEHLENTPYLEIEIGPHGHWYVCMFPGQADFYNKTDDLQLENAPDVRIDRAKKTWTASMVIPSFLIPEPESSDDLSITWMVNAFAMHGVGEHRLHYAYSKCPGESPNFHQLESFKPLVLEELDLSNNNSVSANNNSGVGVSAGGGGGLERGGSNKSIDGGPSKSAIKMSSANDGKFESNKKSIKTLKFSNSTVDQDNSKRLIAEMEALKLKNTGVAVSDAERAKMKAREYCYRFIEMSNEQRRLPGVKFPSLLEISESLRDRYALPQIEECFLKHVHQDEEFVILYGMVVKRKGWSYKERMLILTSKPRLFYLKHPSSSLIFTPKNVKYKGNIPWSIKELLEVVTIDATSFDIVLQDKSRTYHINDKLAGSNRWVEALNAISFCWTSYFLKQSGGDHNKSSANNAFGGGGGGGGNAKR